MIGALWRFAVVMAGANLLYVSGTMPGVQLWLSVPAGFLIGWGVASAYRAEPRL